MKSSWLLLFSIGIFSANSLRGCPAESNTSLLLKNRIFQTHDEDKYDFTKEKIINNLGQFNIWSTDSTIIFDSAHGKIDAPLRYTRNFNNFNFDGVYKIVNNLNESYYFRFGWVTFKDQQTIFSNVKWLKKNVPEPGKYRILTITLKLKQHGSISVCTIGDSQTWWNAANNLRQELNNDFPDLFFVGSRTDVNGYPHEGEGGNHTSQVLARINYIPKADYYTLLLGTNDWQGNIDSAFKNITAICAILLKKYPQSKILYITPLPTTNAVRDSFNARLKEMLIKTFTSSKRIEVVGVGEKMREDLNWSTVYLLNDGLHQNAYGIKLMAEIIADKIKSEHK